MVYRLRNKFIKIMVLSFLAVLTVLFLVVYAITSFQTNSSLDVFADLISANGGFFPKPDDRTANFDVIHHGHRPMNPEAPYTTRFFTVHFDNNGNFAFSDVSSVSSITQEDAVTYAKKAMKKNKDRGWISDYRYKVYETDFGQAVVFVNGVDTKAMNRMYLLTTAGVFAGGSIVVLILVIILSGRAVKPIAESYEKQKQFVTDANHELKTPLALIQTDLELAESELGKNEWLEDIRAASEGMAELVGKLVTLARMDEENTKLQLFPFDLSAVLSDAAYVFEPLMIKKGVDFSINISPGITYVGDEALLRQLVSILLDNAAKYCDPGGRIEITLRSEKHTILTVANTFRGVDHIELKRLFDRFYRSDKARTSGSGSGIGLSIAQSIVEKHHGRIEAQKKEDGIIQFWVRL